MEPEELKKALKPEVKTLKDAVADLLDQAEKLVSVVGRDLSLTAAAEKAGKQAFAEESTRQSLANVREKLNFVQASLVAVDQILPDAAVATVSKVAASLALAKSPPKALESAPVTAENNWGFAEFITSVGNAIVDAQRQLDGQSRQYMMDQLNGTGPHSPGSLPAMFRIPKLSAEIKFALQKDKSKGLNLLLFSDKQKSSEQHQQSIAFDIVAVPPPPELLQQLRAVTPSLEFVLNPEERARIFAAVTSVKDSKTLEAVELTGDPGLPDDQRLAEVQDYVVMVPADLRAAGAAVAQRNRFLLFQADEKEAHLLGIWHLQLEPLSLSSVYRYSAKPKPSENIEGLKRWVMELGEIQSGLLKELRRL